MNFLVEDVIKYLDEVNIRSHTLTILRSSLIGSLGVEKTKVVYRLLNDYVYVTENLEAEIQCIIEDPKEGIFSIPDDMVASVLAQRILDRALDEIFEQIRKEALCDGHKY